ncbi:hypothetical protein COLU111180_06315 [Cohnella lubricantis]|uniref:Uncharacterized protein n=1 Tax=Cohnella lubricantis TaxID=2163172 RepID=A0A841TEV6_9BACL|nr:hypothetical protein [Cohnella lubricantis]MBB6677507.1 hypothetical protein [Cohnella lubricantis]MBP2116607.1 DNA-binding transcriptional regulator PaaX [Cohnella lubricantis]
MRVQRLTDKQILQFVCRNVGFSVTWRWRDDGLRAQCERLARWGWIKRVYSRGRDDYEITDKGREQLAALRLDGSKSG